MGMKRPSKSSKSPPIMSHEFIIQNHADIVSCVAMVFMIGLMFQATSQYASRFVVLQHNVTDGSDNGPSLYSSGFRDLCAVFFYSLLCIIIHQIWQEYVLDKLNRKLHLSKVKISKFNESGQLFLFYVIGASWGIDLIIRENYAINVWQLWEGYPHDTMSLLFKFYFIIQIAYWLHTFPELYFQKIKKADMKPRIRYALLYLMMIVVAYVINMTRLALVVLVMTYAVEAFFHFARLAYFAERQEIAKFGFLIWNILFVVCRLATIILSTLTFWYGLGKTTQPTIDFSAGNYNTTIMRINCLLAVFLVQVWMMYGYISFHLSRRTATEQVIASGKAKPKKRRTKKDKETSEESDEGYVLVGSGEDEKKSTRRRH